MKFVYAFRQILSTPSLQQRLILLLLISGLLPLLLMGSTTTISATRLLELDIGRDLDNMAGTTIDKLDRVMFDRVNDIQTFASSNEARTLDPEILTPYMNQLVRMHSPLYPLMIVADKQGVIRALSTIDTGTYSSLGSSPLGQSVADTDWFRIWFDRPLPAGQSYMTDLHRDSLFAQIRPQASSTVVFSFPIQNERSATIGVWALFLDWHIVETLVDQALIAPRAGGASSLSITMVDKNGMVLIAPDKTAVLRDRIQLDAAQRQA